MTAYVAMLRGINVGGHAKVTMADLRAAFAEMGFDEARTYVQSGNVFFGASGSPTKLRDAIEHGLEARLGLGVRVVLRTSAQLSDIVEHNPLAGGGREPSKLHVTFLASTPASARTGAIDTGAYLPDELRVVGREVYLHCPAGYGRTKLDNSFFERRLEVVATTRTWRTVTTLAGMGP